MNIILKSFDGPGCKQIMENTFKGRHLGTCLSILNNTEQMPNLDADDHIWIHAIDLRAGQYPDVDWTTLIPLDEPLIEAMRPCEAVFMNMITRYAKTKEMSYEERKRRYFEHFRYWNHMLETKKIDLLLSNHVPHQSYDYVIYCLCKLKGIKTLFLERCYILDGFFVVEDWEKSAEQLRGKLDELEKEYPASKDMPLSPKYEQYFQSQTGTQNTDPWYLARYEKYWAEKSFVAKWAKRAWKVLRKRPIQFFRSVLSPAFWSQKWKRHAVLRFYAEHAEAPDLTKRYIYMPLHYQPEASTCPLSGAYTDQERIVQLLATYLPKDVAIYVKEHPAQGELSRSEAFYRSLMEIPAVTLVSAQTSTFALSKNAIAVATGTGTAGFEALFQEKPVLMFGHRFYQYANGIHQISSAEDCKKAVGAVLAGKGKPTLHDARLFLKAVEECAAETYVGSPLSDPKYSDDDRAAIMGKYIAQSLPSS